MDADSSSNKPTLLERLSTMLLREPEDREQLISLLHSAYERNLLDADALSMMERAEVIDFNQPSPAWTFTDPMAFERRHHNLTVLPTGEVLATSGVAGTAFDDVSKGVHPAELWDPTTGHWRTLAPSPLPALSATRRSSHHRTCSAAPAR